MQRYDPATAAAKAIDTYDRNRDGKLAADELKNSPALAASGRRVDRNGDGTLIKEEIQARMEAIEAGADYFPIDLRITAERKPLVGAEVTLAPEPFLGEGYPSYSGTTVEGGVAPLESDGTDLPGIPAGFYQVTIVHSGQGIDAVRGVEVADETAGRGIEIAL